MEVERSFNLAVKADAEHEQRLMLERTKKMREQLEEEKQKTYEITRDMTRQYKDMQDELSNKVIKLESTIKNLEDEMLNDRASFQVGLQFKRNYEETLACATH